MSDKFGGGGIDDLLGALTGGRGGADGLGALLGRLRAGGLSEEVDSWVGSGANKAVAPQQLAQAFGGEELAALAQRLGLGGAGGAAGGGMLAGILAQLLPQLINGLTPQGQVPQDDAEVAQQEGGLGAILSQLGGGAGAQAGGGGLAGMLGALMGGGAGGMLGGLLGGAGDAPAPAPAGKPGTAPLDKSNLGGDGGGPLPQKPRPL